MQNLTSRFYCLGDIGGLFKCKYTDFAFRQPQMNHLCHNSSCSADDEPVVLLESLQCLAAVVKMQLISRPHKINEKLTRATENDFIISEIKYLCWANKNQK